MTFKSAQVEYSGQQGWNDLTPEAVAVPGSRGRRPRPRRVYTEPSQIIAQQSTTALPLPPLNLPAHPPQLTSASSPSLNAPAPVPSSSVTSTSYEEVLTNLKTRISSTLDEQKTLSLKKLEQVIPTLAQNHLLFIETVLNEQDQKTARDMLVAYSLQHSHVSAWIIPLKRLI